MWIVIRKKNTYMSIKQLFRTMKTVFIKLSFIEYYIKGLIRERILNNTWIYIIYIAYNCQNINRWYNVRRITLNVPKVSRIRYLGARPPKKTKQKFDPRLIEPANRAICVIFHHPPTYMERGGTGEGITWVGGSTEGWTTLWPWSKGI